MIEFLSASSYFGIVLTLVLFCVAYVINKKLPCPITTPLFLATVFVIVVLVYLDIPYAQYNASAQYHKNRALTSRKGAGHLVVKVYMARRID